MRTELAWQVGTGCYLAVSVAKKGGLRGVFPAGLAEEHRSSHLRVKCIERDS